MRALRALLVAGAIVAAAVFAGSGSASRTRALQNVTCSGGSIAPGRYDSIDVTGFCDVPAGVVTVRRDLTIEAGAGLNAIEAGTLRVLGNLDVDSGAILGLGCSPAIGCPFTTHDAVNGALNATEPAALLVHSATLGSVSSDGGSVGVNCNFDPNLGAPDYVTFEDNHIARGADISGYTGCWFGFIRNRVEGDVTLDDNVNADPDAMEVVTNTIFGNLSCFDNFPTPQVGDSGGLPNVVFGQKLGQCAGLP